MTGLQPRDSHRIGSDNDARGVCYYHPEPDALVGTPKVSLNIAHRRLDPSPTSEVQLPVVGRPWPRGRIVNRWREQPWLSHHRGDIVSRDGDLRGGADAKHQQVTIIPRLNSHRPTVGTSPCNLRRIIKVQGQ